MAIYTEYYERTDPRLGRFVAHDERSRGYAYGFSFGERIQSVRWERHAPIFDQGRIGSCTGNAMAGALATGPVWDAGHGHLPNETDAETWEEFAVEIYSAATKIDRIKGVYPPVDTGSAGLYVAKVAKQESWISAYQHAFVFRSFLAALQRGPVIVGTKWYNSMFTPSTAGLVNVDTSSGVAGGHEYLARGYDAEGGFVEFDNSWGDGWGAAGSFTMHVFEFAPLLQDRGDATVPIPLEVS